MSLINSACRVVPRFQEGIGLEELDAGQPDPSRTCKV